MNISYNWLKDYLDINCGTEELSAILTSIGLEVEGIEEWESIKGGLEKFVIGKVLTCCKHPDADRLSLTTVDAGGSQPLNIVCGAPNVAAGQTVVVATEGAIIYKGKEQFEIKRSKIRGQQSEGMICAEDEIGIGTSHEGILVLEDGIRPGTPAAEYFKVVKDTIFAIGLTPNRIDCSSHFGVARDLAAYFNLKKPVKVTLPDVSNFKPGIKKNPLKVTVESPERCLRYTGLTIRNITVKESPEWLRTKLSAIGLTPINNVVDITNFILHELGQPLHAFDADTIGGNSVIVKTLPEKTKFTTLDGMEHELASSDLMICDANEGMCIAGVYGGLKSGITANTKNMFLESACFNPVSVRKTSRRHDLHTDASYRFERGTDPEITIYAIKRAAQLILELAGGEIDGDMTDIYPLPVKKAVVDLTYENTTRLIGKEIPAETIKTILKSLDIVTIAENHDGLKLEIPPYRVDVTREADVIEEILRIYGYNNVEIGLGMNSVLTHIEKPDREKVLNNICDMLSANGFAEIMCNSLTPSAWYETTGDYDTKQMVTLANPLSSDLNAMRLSLLPGMLNTVIWNINRQNPDLKLYETGYSYFRMPDKGSKEITENYTERMDLDIMITGVIATQRWNSPSTPTGFFHLKGYVEMILNRLGINIRSLTVNDASGKWFSSALSYSAGNIEIASFGSVSRKYLHQFDIKQDVFYAHIDWENLLKIQKKNKIAFSELPKFPSVRRDLALLVDRSVKFSRIREIAFSTEKYLLREVDLFDVYESDSLGKDKKSYAVSFILRDDNKTLTDNNIEKIMNSLTNAFSRELGASLR
ncbi:MAG TPA: phenylalanine--tRNA ligase subunit beta [Bacteroidales bacterium]|nr:phenylalanine--tRNA ligase subunit beta [Bacteroidales bacterium]